MFFFDLALCCRSTCQFRWNSEKSNHMISATSNIELEFLTKFLNVSQFQNSNIDWFCCLRGCHYILPGLYASRRRHAGKLALKISPQDLRLVMLQGSSGTVIFRWLGCFLQSREPASSTDSCYWSKPWGYKTSTQKCTFKQIKILILYINLRASLGWQKFSALCLDRILIALMFMWLKKFLEPWGSLSRFLSKTSFPRQ